jgi:TetR/AcrR family transcriptional regulator, transcriptional repressor for nem operon
MARRTAAEKADTHAAIVRQATKLFRERGSSVGIADVMDDAGLTHGGFYRHFESKDDLIVEAVSLALHELSDRLTRAAERAEQGRELEAIITAYLSTDHLAHPETWCALATLAGDLGRLPSRARKRLDIALTEYMERLIGYMPGSTIDNRRQNFIVLISGMAGAIAMLRVFGDKAVREAALSMVRDYYVKTFAGDR